MNAHSRQWRLSDEWASSHIGRLLEENKISRAEFEAAKEWRLLYLDYLASIGAPGYERDEPFSDLRCKDLKDRVSAAIDGMKKKKLRRSFHALSALVVYEEPEELGDFEFTVEAARIGLAHLSKVGF